MIMPQCSREVEEMVRGDSVSPERRREQQHRAMNRILIFHFFPFLLSDASALSLPVTQKWILSVTDRLMPLSYVYVIYS